MDAIGPKLLQKERQRQQGEGRPHYWCHTGKPEVKFCGLELQPSGGARQRLASRLPRQPAGAVSLGAAGRG